VAKLGRKRGTVKREATCVTGFGTCVFTTADGDEVGIISPTMRGMERVWDKLSLIALDKTMVTRVVYFKHKSLTTLRPRRSVKNRKVEP